MRLLQWLVVPAFFFSTPAAANWLAKCESPGGCSAEMCGATAQDARRACINECPNAQITSISTSSCTLPSDAPPTPPASPAAIEICAQPPADQSSLVFGASTTINPRGQEWVSAGPVPAAPAGQVRKIYCIASYPGESGWCSSATGRCYGGSGQDGQARFLVGSSDIQADGSWRPAALIANEDRRSSVAITLAYDGARGVRFRERLRDVDPDWRLVALAGIGGALGVGGVILALRRRRRRD